MTDLLTRPDETITPLDEDTIHVICQGTMKPERTVPMIAVCGYDTTFDAVVEDEPNCKECLDECPAHVACLKQAPNKACLLLQPR